MGRAIAWFAVAPGPATSHPPKTHVGDPEINRVGEMNCGMLDENRHCHDINPAGLTALRSGPKGTRAGLLAALTKRLLTL
ncbi:MAG TPA: hypothetical protein VFU43_28025 [Streptosporangiaceae bacterium]|nr:hypothetical protein [Streptosporangiaceae bacterium]